MASKNSKGVPPEFDALGKVLEALRNGLDDQQRAWVIASAVSNLGISGVALPGLGLGDAGTQALGGGGGGTAKTTVVAGQPGTAQHAKAWLRVKAPKSVLQQVACLAFYLTNFKSTPHFKAKEIDDMNREAGGARIGNPRQSTNDAMSKSGFLSVAGGGKKQITAFGEEVVNALPDQVAVKAIPAPRKGRKKKPVKKSK
jgi:hypothetical protein